jgi:hypothetical protein
MPTEKTKDETYPKSPASILIKNDCFEPQETTTTKLKPTQPKESNFPAHMNVHFVFAWAVRFCNDRTFCPM